MFSREYSLIIFDEHGIRYTEVGKTLQGKLEERLPFMPSIVLRWFTEKYQDLYKNFIHNSKVLTTLFDVYATLRHILSYPNYPGDTITGQSLQFTKIYKRSPLSIKWSGSLFTKSQRPVCIVLYPYPNEILSFNENSIHFYLSKSMPVVVLSEFLDISNQWWAFLSFLSYTLTLF